MPVYKGENGKYYVSFYYMRWDGKRVRKKKEGFKTKKEAMLYERDFLLDQEGKIELTFDKLLEKYLEDSKARVKPTTYENNEFIINKNIRPYFKDLKIKDIEAITIRTWQNTLLLSEKNYSQTYLKTINNRLSAIFNYAVQFHKLEKNPCKLSSSMGKKNANSMKFWTKDEYDIFIKGIEDKIMSKVIYDVLFYTGIRVGELLALTLNDFNFETKVMSITKTYAKLKGGKDLIQEPKTPKSRREIVIPETLCDEVKKFAELRYDYKPDERLFVATKYYLHHEMNRGSKNTGIKRIRIHDIRHSHASLLIEMGVSPIAIAERLGHDDIQTTLQTYSHLYPNKQEEIAEKLEKYMTK